MFIFDARKMECPLPVIETKKRLQDAAVGEELIVLTDNEIAVQNLIKYANQMAYPVSSRQTEESTFEVKIIKIAPDADSIENAAAKNANSSERINQIVALSSNLMGSGEQQLGQALMKGFVFALTRLERMPDTVLLYNSGAFLSCDGSETLQDLILLEEKGVEILTCGTCLNYYGLTEKLKVGSVTNMYEIVEKMQQAGQILRP